MSGPEATKVRIQAALSKCRTVQDMVAAFIGHVIPALRESLGEDECPSDDQAADTLNALLTDNRGPLRFRGGVRGPSCRPRSSRFACGVATILRWHMGLNYEGLLFARFDLGPVDYRKAETLATALFLLSGRKRSQADVWAELLGTKS